MCREHKRPSKLLGCFGVEYNPSTDRIVADDEWWARKLRRTMTTRISKTKISARYTLNIVSYDNDKYAVTSTKLCRTSFYVFEDSALEDHRDVILVNGKSSGSSDDGDEGKGKSNVKSGDKRKTSAQSRKGKKKTVFVRELLFSVDRANSAAEEVAAKINTIIAPNDNAGAECVEELLSTGRL